MSRIKGNSLDRDEQDRRQEDARRDLMTACMVFNSLVHNKRVELVEIERAKHAIDSASLGEIAAMFKTVYQCLHPAPPEPIPGSLMT